MYDHETPLLDDLADLLYLALPTLILFELMIVPSVWSSGICRVCIYISFDPLRSDYWIIHYIIDSSEFPGWLDNIFRDVIRALL